MRTFITAEQAISVLPDSEYIHTFRSAVCSIVGTDWTRDEIIKSIECADHIELSGETARAMGHGICIYNNDAEDLLFIETNEEKLADIENGESATNKCKYEQVCGETKMNIGDAWAVFKQINSDKYTDAEKMDAIDVVVNAESHNSMRKDEILEAFKWFLNRNKCLQSENYCSKYGAKMDEKDDL